ncbi:hypothetical protein GGI02_000557, partial [Coemansia sp. RSA 2322]
MVDNVSGGMPNAKYLQWCDDKDPAKTAGIIIDASGNKEAVRQAMQQWSMGKCWSTKTGDATWNNKDLWFFSYEDRKNGYVTPDPGMGVCNYKTVVAGDIMTTKCGVTRDSLMIFNPGLNVDNPPIGMPVCCSAGALPNLKPPADPNPDGSCRVHTVVTGQSCEAILATYYPMTKADLMGYNKDTYGWMGCGGAYPWDKTKICISNGTPPRPVATWNAECGSLAPGDKYKIKMDLNATSEFASFKSLYNVKKIVSFGGWGISTDVGTYQHLRNAMLPGNVDTVVTNLVNWMNASQLDGLDIDWEYPGAPDIKGIPPGLASDAPNYLNFLKKLKAKMPVGKSLSIAAPASYWYLKQFPITDMAQQLDYIESSREEEGEEDEEEFFVRGVYMKDEKKFLSDMTSMLKVNMTMSLFKWGKFDAPLPWGCRQQGGFCQSPPSQIVFDSFPIIDMDMFIPDPMGSVESNMTSIIDFTKKLDVATTKWVEDPMDIVAGSRLPLMSLVS